MKTMIQLTSILGLLALTACGTANDNTSATLAQPGATQAAGSVDAGEFTLYTTPNAVPAEGCDVHTHLTLVNGFTAPVASMAQEKTGPCRLRVDTTERVYNLRQVADQCGSRHYIGEGIDLLDHRTRLCKDRVPAQIVITLSPVDGDATVQLFSLDQPRT